MSTAIEQLGSQADLAEKPACVGSHVLLRPIEATSAILLVVITALLLAGVCFRYVLAWPVPWIDEVVSIAFLWVAMLGSVLAVARNEHLRLTLFVNLLSPRRRAFVETLSLLVVATFLLFLVKPSIEYVESEWVMRSIALNIPNSFRAAALATGIVLMLVVVVSYGVRRSSWSDLAVAACAVAAVGALFALLAPALQGFVSLNIFIFLVLVVLGCLAGGVPIAFCFGVGAMCYLAFATSTPMSVMIGRMDEGTSNMILVSVPIFVLLGCVLDSTGMGKAIIDFLASLIGHVKAGMSYVLLGALFVVSGISGSKVSDMATVAPALFPEMRRRGQKPKEMIALLATGAAMADTVPPSIMLIVLGSVAGVSIAGLFNAGLVVAAVLLMVLLALARWKAGAESLEGLRRAPLAVIGRTMLIAAPAIFLPFLIRGAVGGGVATATEVSSIAVLYALIVGAVLYGGISWRKLYSMLVETAALSGAILLILGTALSMSWVLAQSGIARQLEGVMTSLPGGTMSFMLVTIFVFLFFGSLLEGMPALLLLAPLMFPIARQMGINDVHYAMVVVIAMNIGLMMPPIGVGFYIACRIGNVSPDEAMGAIWPYILALLVGLLVIAAVPAISTTFA